MKQKILFYFFSILTLLTFAACGSAEAGGFGQGGSGSGGRVALDHCPEATASTVAYVSATYGVCFLHPDNYQVQETEEGFTLYVDSLLNTEAPIASFSFEAANGRPVGDVAAEKLVAFGLPENSTMDSTIGGQAAIIIDNLPGQDINRRLIAVYEDRVLDLMVARIGTEYGEVGVAAEALFSTIADSLQFTAIEPAG